jgi:ribosomal protein L37AE/L43A
MNAFRMLASDLRDVAGIIGNLLVFRVSILVMAAIVFALFLAIAGNTNVTILAFVFNLTAAAAEGVLLGFLTRTLLAERSFLMRLGASLAALLAGLFFLGWVTDGFLGIFPLPFPRRVPDRLALVLTAAGTIGLFLTLLAWRTRRGNVSAGSALSSPVEHAPLVVEPPAPAAIVVSPAPSRPATRWLNRIRSGIHLPQRRDPALDIRLVGAEEHRCPYCLQSVTRRDPRGIVICPDCKTWHHKDCWSITGMCQIPHEHPV